MACCRYGKSFVTEMMELVAEKGIEMHYTEKDLEEDINAALKE